MCAHDAQHALGVIVNKPKDELTVGDVLEHLGIPVAGIGALHMVLDGGPVKPERGFVVHSPEFTAGEATQTVGPGLALTTSRDVLEAMGGPNAPERYTLALGCSSWGAGQLEEELRGNAWLVVECDAAIVFDDNHAQKWERAIRRLGIDPAQLVGAVGSA
jgi:putative transcriptional regulator